VGVEEGCSAFGRRTPEATERERVTRHVSFPHHFLNFHALEVLRLRAKSPERANRIRFPAFVEQQKVLPYQRVKIKPLATLLDFINTTPRASIC
jgi:hypothetical protein